MQFSPVPFAFPPICVHFPLGPSSVSLNSVQFHSIALVPLSVAPVLPSYPPQFPQVPSSCPQLPSSSPHSLTNSIQFRSQLPIIPLQIFRVLHSPSPVPPSPAPGPPPSSTPAPANPFPVPPQFRRRSVQFQQFSLRLKLPVDLPQFHSVPRQLPAVPLGPRTFPPSSPAVLPSVLPQLPPVPIKFLQFPIRLFPISHSFPQLPSSSLQSRASSPQFSSVPGSSIPAPCGSPAVLNIFTQFPSSYLHLQVTNSVPNNSPVPPSSLSFSSPHSRVGPVYRSGSTGWWVTITTPGWRCNATYLLAPSVTNLSLQEARRWTRQEAGGDGNARVA